MNKPQTTLTEAEYKAALQELDAFYNHEPEPGTPDAERFETIQLLVETYETDRFQANAPSTSQAQSPSRRR